MVKVTIGYAQCVAGGQPQGLSLQENMIKECEEVLPHGFGQQTRQCAVAAAASARSPIRMGE